MRSGHPIFSHAFSSTIAGKAWAKVPNLMKKLYAGELGQSDATAALVELDQVSKGVGCTSSQQGYLEYRRSRQGTTGGDNIATPPPTCPIILLPLPGET
jgi:hypothetical protein